MQKIRKIHLSLRWLQPEYNDDPFKYFCRARRSDRTPVISPLRLVNDHERQILRTVGGETAYERGDILPLRNASVLILLRRTRFACHAVSFDVRLLAAPVP